MRVVNSDEESDVDSDEYQDIPEEPAGEKVVDLQSQLRNVNSDEESDESDSTEEEKMEEGKPVEESGVDDVIEEGRLFIRNLPYSCTEEEVKEYAKQFGEITDVFIPLNSKRESKGYGFVTFMFPEHAIGALEVSMIERTKH